MKHLMTRDMKLGYRMALDDAEEQLAKYLGPLHAGRVAVNSLEKNIEPATENGCPMPGVAGVHSDAYHDDEMCSWCGATKSKESSNDKAD